MPKERLYYLNCSQLINKKPFRISKNGVPTNIFKKAPNDQVVPANSSFQNNFGKNNLNVIRINLLKRNELHGKGGESKIIEEDEK